MRIVVLVFSLHLALPSLVLSEVTIGRTVIGAGCLGSVGTDHAIVSTLGQAVAGRSAGPENAIHTGYWPNGSRHPTALGDPITPAFVPGAFVLHQNWPNPFSVKTAITYDVPASGGEVRIAIYGVDGRIVRTLVSGEQSVGRKRVEWNGRDEAGRTVGAGVYFCALTAPSYRKTLKMARFR